MRCFIIGVAVSAGLVLNAPALIFAQNLTASPSTVTPAAIQTETSRVYVFVDRVGLGHPHGVEAKLLKSSLVLGATENAGQLIFDMTSFDADTQAARKYVGLAGVTDEGTRTAVNQNMKGSAVLNVRRYPTATLDVTSAKATGQTNAHGLTLYQLDGQLTLHGNTRPISIMVEVEQVRGWLHVRGAFSIKQTDFGITPYSKAFGAVGVANELRIYGDLFVAPTTT